MSRFNTQTSHPLIPNSQEYTFEQQHISVHSEDRNMLKYPNPSEFEIELPQDYLNVQGFRLVSGFFPAKINTFSKDKKNVTMTFTITDPYNPSDHGSTDADQIAIYTTLSAYTSNYVVLIEDGTYTPAQMRSEIENKMNAAVTDLLLGTSSTLTPTQKTTLEAAGGYTEFVVTYNELNRRLWIGNTSSAFELTNTYVARYEESTGVCLCDGSDALPAFKDWGLPGYLGFTRCDETSTQLLAPNDARFYYLPGQSGIWLQPNSVLPGATAHYIQAPMQLSIDPPPYIYMETRILNSMDETAPYNYSKFTQETNQTNGVVKAAFAKIPMNSSIEGFNYYEELNVANNFKIYNPPVERIRKLSIRFRHHNGMLVDFGNADYTFTLELTIMRPNNNRVYNMRVPESISNNF